MNIEINRVKIVVTVPSDYVNLVRDQMCESGSGIIGNYTYCSTSTNCIGTFKPNENANPFIGKYNALEFVDEVKLEVICDVNNVNNVVSKLRSIHPYEEPSIDIIPLIDETYFK